MPHDTRAFLHDILTAIGRIRRFTHQANFDCYLADEMLRAAVERQFEIIGEALNQLQKADPELAGTIPHYRRIIAFRNVLIHGYASIDHKLVWGVLETELDTLERAVKALLPE